ncbi:MAG: TldD/PmbA family protein [Clostridia bacterium]|nr:TldD/PmbA family protein [Clostridia bacterium]
MSLDRNLLKTKSACKKLVEELLKTYEYVSILGEANKGLRANVNFKNVSISDSDISYGFVAKIFNGAGYSEYSFSYIDDNCYLDIAKKIQSEIKLDNLKQERVSVKSLKGESIKKSFARENDNPLTIPIIKERLTKIKDALKNTDERIIQGAAILNRIEISKIFIDNTKELDQYYTWTNSYIIAIATDGENIKQAREVKGSPDTLLSLDSIEKEIKNVSELAIKLLNAKQVVPGVYDVITDPSITGLIAHEAFGHGVEMDMFVKNRAKAKEYINKRVASDLVNMHDGAAAATQVASFFFDDDGVISSDTLIIKNGILQTGISDCLSALELKTTPTGNGRRENYAHKAYTRMTNTYFEPGKDKLEDMIKSIKFGYYLCDTNNGMEDPKNWQIQCTAEYGLEIVDGKFTGNIVSPVVMSGYVPDLLQSISMVSDEFRLDGAGYCGKGHKEWVRVCDGGPHLKARVKLG